MITHSAKLMESVHPDYVHILVNGKIVKTGDYSLAEYINKNGFAEFEKK